MSSGISSSDNASSDESNRPISRSTKRRKIGVDKSLSVAEHEGQEASSSDSLAHSRCSGPDQEKENNDPEAISAKKSKYRIHVPKNYEMPQDTFCTQPTATPSSPYRIDKFRWKKPKAILPSQLPQSKISQKSPPFLNTKSYNASSDYVSDLQAEQTRRGNLQSNEKMSLPQVNHLQPSEKSPHKIESNCENLFNERLVSNRDDQYDTVLADLPSDAFSSPEPVERGTSNQPIAILSQQVDSESWSSEVSSQQKLVAPLTNLRQTTLFGEQTVDNSAPSQPNRRRNWPTANKEEPPTHHKLDHEELKTWVYPTNLGNIRDYQYSIVARGLYHNMLVALPTGLGKTFIAATIMLNWFRWTTEAQIVFVAPTKPLVSQQVTACFNIAGIPRSATTMLTGGTAPGIRAEEWRSKRVFFMTPQTIVNDLKTGICDPKRLVLLVVDEAHRATGGYAYVEVVKFLRRSNSSFRVLALTATPGSSIESVQEVIDGLGISRIEIRTEESLDIRHYVHPRKVETVLFDSSDEMVMIMDLFAKAVQPLVDKLCGMNAYWGKDPMTLTPYGCNQAKTRWVSSDVGRKSSYGLKGMVIGIFSLLASLAHGIELLKFHGIGPFYHKVVAFRNETEAAGSKASKYKKQITEAEPFRIMMSRIQVWINNSDFIGHPKLEYLQSVVLNHFLDAGEGRGSSDPSGTRIMIFSHYRDSAEEISRVLKRKEPMIRPRVFVGQANSKGSDGMDQKTQLDVIRKFQTGIYNTLVATSIGEEGLDIGEIDLIVCYDASASPVRMLQRMGRTGRKRAGNIVVTLMRGKEENNFIKAKDNYEKMQHEIASGAKFNFHDEDSRRIVPKDVQPVVDKRIIEIPLENTQADLPEPRKRAKTPKRPPKKFNMPDGVRKGFVKASRLNADDETDEDGGDDETAHSDNGHHDLTPEPIPSLNDVLLTVQEQEELERRYLDIAGDAPEIVDVPRVDAFPSLQRSQRPVHRIGHSRNTKRTVDMLNEIHSLSVEQNPRYEWSLTAKDRDMCSLQAARRANYFKALMLPKDSRRSLNANLDVLGSRQESSNPHSLVERGILADGSLAVEIGLRNSVDDEPDEETGGFLSANLGHSQSHSDTSSINRRPSVDKSHSSDEDLPTFDTLVDRNEKVLEIHTRSNTRDISESHKRKRRVVDDDSDE
ncbi:MAG: hypothetical protein Q9190_005784 [Brigantiaea leucoxantha]